MRVKVEEAGSGLHPSQVLVKIKTLHGPQELAVDRQSLHQGTIEIGSPIAKQAKYRLIELPAETAGGAWRVWVDVDETITSDGELEAAE